MMAAKKINRPKARPRLVIGTLGELDPQTASRLLSNLGDAHQQLAAQVSPRESHIVDLAIGATVVNHGLGRKPSGAHVSPTVANATWSSAMTSATDKQVTITTVGVAQPKATVEVF